MRVILTGASGRMGRQMLALFQSVGDIDVIAVDKVFAADFDKCFPDVIGVYKSISEVKESADVIVDFSLHTAMKEVAEFALEKRIPLVVATTGHTEDEKACVTCASRFIPVFMSSNMSLAIAHIKEFAAKLAVVFSDADIEIVEVHHSKKADFPSGTALSIAKRIVKERGFGKLVTGQCNGRERGDINIHSLRMGESLGEHKIIIDTGTERIIISHETHSRAVYASGALKAMKFVMTKNNGLFGIEDILQ